MKILTEASPEFTRQLQAQQRVHSQISIIKELLENSIDSGATNVKIFVDSKTHGVDFIKVEDNGSGIDKSDLENVFSNSYTSKWEKDDSDEPSTEYYGNHAQFEKRSIF